MRHLHLLFAMTAASALTACGGGNNSNSNSNSDSTSPISTPTAVTPSPVTSASPPPATATVVNTPTGGATQPVGTQPPTPAPAPVTAPAPVPVPVPTPAPAPVPAPAPIAAPVPAPTPAPAPAPAPTPTPTPAPAPIVGPAIASIGLAQSQLMAATDPALILIASKDVLVKVDVTGTDPANKPAGVLHVQDANGTAVGDLALTAPTADVPTAVPAVPNVAAAYSVVLPARLVKTGLRLVASLANGRSMTVDPRVGGGVPLTLVSVPFQVGSAIGQVTPGSQPFVQSRLPAASIAMQTHATYVAQTPAPSDGNWSAQLGNFLNELNALFVLEGSPAGEHYFGLIPAHLSGQGYVVNAGGLGIVGGQTAVGDDSPEWASQALHVMTHELGHNLGLIHAPCGTTGDPNYPYPNATLGEPGHYTWGYIADTAAWVDPTDPNTHDMMSYCGGNSFSDYNTALMQAFLTPADKVSATSTSMRTTAVGGTAAADSAEGTGTQEALLVHGLIDGAKATLSPVKSLLATVRLPASGPYTLHVTTASGETDYAFAAQRIDHYSTQSFAFTIPNPGTISSMSITASGNTLVRTTAAAHTDVAGKATIASASARALVAVSETAGTASLKWDSGRYPYLTVTWVGQHRTTLAQDLRGGSASIATRQLPAGGQLEFILSDGLNSTRVSQAR